MVHTTNRRRTRRPRTLTPGGWRRWQSDRIEAAMVQIDDSTELWDEMADELAEREHGHQVRVLNGGILP